MKNSIITFCLILLAISVSCKKEDLDGGTMENPFIPKLSKIMVDNESFKEYFYNDLGLIRQEQSKFDFTQHNYNENGQLASSDIYVNDDILSSDLTIYETAMNQEIWVTPSSGSKSGVITYEYNESGQLVKSLTTRPSLEVVEFSEFNYNAENRVSKQIMYWDNTATGYIDYTYDSNGNLESEILYNLGESGTPELVTTTTYAYDNETNPFRVSCKSVIPGPNTNPNNIIKETYTIHSESVQASDKEQVTVNTYEYNSLGYPVSKNGNITYTY
jgi:hypothetical protein